MFEIGQSASYSRQFSDSDISSYIALGGQPVTGREVPEPLIGALFSYLLGVRLPGTGTNYLKQESRFLCSASIDELLTAQVIVTRLRPEMDLVNLRTTCRGREKRLICEGSALVLISDVSSRESPSRGAHESLRNAVSGDS